MESLEFGGKFFGTKHSRAPPTLWPSNWPPATGSSTTIVVVQQETGGRPTSPWQKAVRAVGQGAGECPYTR